MGKRKGGGVYFSFRVRMSRVWFNPSVTAVEKGAFKGHIQLSDSYLEYYWKRSNGSFYFFESVVLTTLRSRGSYLLHEIP